MSAMIWMNHFPITPRLPQDSHPLRPGGRIARFFEAIVEQCRQAKLIWGKELYFDVTQVEANADLDSLVPRFAVEAREAIHEHLAALFAPEPANPEVTEENHRVSLVHHLRLAEEAPPAPFPLPRPISRQRHEELVEENAA